MERPWSTTTRIFVLALVLAFLGWLAIAARPVLAPIIIAALLAYLLDPIVSLLMRRFQFSRQLAANIVYGLFMAILIGLPMVMGTVAYRQVRRFESEIVDEIAEIKYSVSQPIVILDMRLDPKLLIDNLNQAANNAMSILPQDALNIISDVTTNLLLAIVVLVSLYYFLKDGTKIKPWLVSLAPADFQLELRRLLDEIDHAWRLFLRVQLLIFIIFTLLLALSMYLVVRLYQANVLPRSPLVLILIIVFIYFLMLQVDNVWLRPQLLGAQLRLHPGLVFIALIVGLALGGVLGAIVIIPSIASAKILGGYVRRKLLDLEITAPLPDVGVPITASGKKTIKENAPGREGLSKS